MKKYYPKNFNPADFYGEDGAIVFEKDWLYDENSIWRLHLNDAEGKFPSHLANSIWFDFTAALDYFCQYYEGLLFDDSVDKKKALVKFKLDLQSALLICFQKVKDSISKKYGLNQALYKFSPFIYESCLFEDDTYDNRQYVSLMSAYSILQIDEGITGLLEKDAVKSASCFHYSAKAIDCIFEQILYESKDDLVRKAFSDRARKGALARNSRYEPLREMVKELVESRNFKSRRNAAMTIKQEIISESIKLNIPFSEAQAEITITNWLSQMGLPANIKL